MVRMRYKYSAMYDGPVFWHYHNLPPDCTEQQLADGGCVKSRSHGLKLGSLDYTRLGLFFTP